jgi:hypothetical protein
LKVILKSADLLLHELGTTELDFVIQMQRERWGADLRTLFWLLGKQYLKIH